MSKFVIRKVPTGVKFDLKAPNGRCVLTSEVYTTEAACLSGIASVRRNAPEAGLEDRTGEGWEKRSNPRFELYRDRNGEYRFRLKARNGKVIGVSDGYATHGGALGGIESVMQNAAEAEIEE